MKNLKIFFCFVMIAVFSGIGIEAKNLKDDQPFNQYYVRAKKKMNVRASSNTSSEIVYQLEKGEDALVIGESGEWLRIKPKDGFFAWVNKEMVENGLIAKDNVNIRVSPSVEGSSLGKLSEGEPVMVVKTEGEWIQIEMPRGYGFWVSTNLVKFLCPASHYQEYLLKQKDAIKAFQDAEELRKQEFTKRYFEVDHEKIIKAYQDIINKYPDTTEAIKAQERIVDTKEKQSMAGQKTMTLKELKMSLSLFEEAEGLFKKLTMDQKVDEAAFQEVVEKYKYITDHYGSTKEAKESLARLDELEKMKKDKVQAIPVFKEEGKLKLNKEPAYPEAQFVLTKGLFGKTIVCALTSKNVDLRAFDKKTVEIEGKVVTSASDANAYPLVEIEKITLK